MGRELRRLLIDPQRLELAEGELRLEAAELRTALLSQRSESPRIRARRRRLQAAAVRGSGRLRSRDARSASAPADDGWLLRGSGRLRSRDD
jgi:hypothetical protein